MDIRSATETDIAALIKVQRLAIGAGYPSPLRENLLGDPNICAGELEWRWRAGDAFIVVVRGAEVLGYACVASPPSETELVALFVHPVHWRKGLGTRLVFAAIEVARSFDASILLVKANPLFAAFYEAIGFQLVSVDEMAGLMVPTMELAVRG